MTILGRDYIRYWMSRTTVRFRVAGRLMASRLEFGYIAKVLHPRIKDSFLVLVAEETSVGFSSQLVMDRSTVRLNGVLFSGMN